MEKLKGLPAGPKERKSEKPSFSAGRKEKRGREGVNRTLL